MKIGTFALNPVQRLAMTALKHAPSGPLTRAVLDQMINLSDGAFEATPNTQIWNMTGQPAMNVPLWRNDAGLPIGVQLAGRFGDEKRMFRLAHQLERARPWTTEMPAIAVA